MAGLNWRARAGVPAAAGALAALLLVGACGGDDPPVTPPVTATRAYRLGFSEVPPRPVLEEAVAALMMWSSRADVATLTSEPPWAELLDGATPASLVIRDKLPVVEFWRGQGLDVWVCVDPANGLDRSADSAALAARGRSLREPAVQAMFRRWCVVLDSLVQPAHLGLAMETNLIRALSPPDLYTAVRTAATGAAADVRARNAAVKLNVSVQADLAWARLAGSGAHEVETDLADFPFAQELGLSSYPGLAGWTHPDSLPVGYYRDLLATRPGLPVFVSEGGWASVGPDSDPQKQRAYIERQGLMVAAAGAVAYFQLHFADLDLAAWPVPEGSVLPLFADMGLVDVDLGAKPALAVWDSLFALPYEGP